MLVGELLTRLGFQVDNSQLSAGMSQAKGVLSEFKGFLGKLALGYSFAEIGKAIISSAGEMESMNAQFTTMLGSADQASKLMEKIQGYAAKTSFETPDVSRSVQTLMQFGMSADQAYATMQKLGDVAGADKNRFAQLSLAMAQVSSAGLLHGQDLLQLVNAGWNPLRTMSDMTGKSIAQLRKEMEKGAITSGMVADALTRVTSAGGMFYKNQEKQSQTWIGVVSTAMDNLKLNASKAMENLMPIMKSFVKAIGEIPLEWLGDALHWVSQAMYYLGYIMQHGGVIDAVNILKGALLYDLLPALQDAVGGSRGTGDALQILGNVVAYLTLNFVRGIIVLVRLMTYMAQVAGWLREHKTLVQLLAAAIVGIVGAAALSRLHLYYEGLRLIVRGTKLWGSAVEGLGPIIEGFRISKIGALKTAMWDLQASAAGFRNSFSNAIASNTLAMGALVTAAMWALEKIREATKEWSKYRSEKRHQDRNEELANLNTQAGIHEQRAKAAKDAGNMFVYNAEMNLAAPFRKKASEISKKDSQDYAGNNEQKGFDQFNTDMLEELRKSRELQEKMLEESKKQGKTGQDIKAKLSVDVKGAGGVGPDVVKLLNRHLRSTWTMDVQRALAGVG